MRELLQDTQPITNTTRGGRRALLLAPSAKVRAPSRSERAPSGAHGGRMPTTSLLTRSVPQVGKLDRGRTYAPKFPGATRNRVKGQKNPGATRQNPTKRAKMPKISRHYAPGDPPHQISPHILNMYLQPFFPTWSVPRLAHVLSFLQKRTKKPQAPTTKTSSFPHCVFCQSLVFNVKRLY